MSAHEGQQDEATIRQRIREIHAMAIGAAEKNRMIQELMKKKPSSSSSSAAAATAALQEAARTVLEERLANAGLQVLSALATPFTADDDDEDGFDLTRTVAEMSLERIAAAVRNKPSWSRKLTREPIAARMRRPRTSAARPLPLTLSPVGRQWMRELLGAGADENCVRYAFGELLADVAFRTLLVPSSGPIEKGPRTPCKYGSACYRVNPTHISELCHPGDADFRAHGSLLTGPADSPLFSSGLEGEAEAVVDDDEQVEADVVEEAESNAKRQRVASGSSDSSSSRQPKHGKKESRFQDGFSAVEPAAVFGCWKSDELISEELRKELIDGVDRIAADMAPDWHPGSAVVLDIVHPSLFPLVNGISELATGDAALRYLDTGDLVEFMRAPRVRSAARPNSRLRQLQEVMVRLPADCSAEELTAAAVPLLGNAGSRQTPDSRWSSCFFQWLPSEFQVDASGRVAIRSYINNLHPVKHSGLYRTLERVFERMLPLFEETLCDAFCGSRPLRLPEPDFTTRLVPNEDYDANDEDNEEDEFHEEETLMPPPVPAQFPDPSDKIAQWLQSRPQVGLRSANLQVIVKLADIRLGPENPSSAGSSWHVEGMRDESIVASGIYYFDAQNVISSAKRREWHPSPSLAELCWRTISAFNLDTSPLHPRVLAHRPQSSASACHTELSFRGSVCAPDYPQFDNDGVAQCYGLVDEGPLCQPRGSIVTTPGRAICFPNVLQHRVDDFELQIPSRPGYRRILVFWLCNPSHRILSTANVPPQQRDWYPLQQSPQDDHDAQGLGSMPYSLDHAKLIRRVLMEERKRFVTSYNESYEREFSLCEH
ncbi:MAG: DUF4246 family protein [archaeon]|nr:DUF4246 family protein [archaeon]